MLNLNLSDVELSLNEYKRYSRQLLLPQIQLEGQKRLGRIKLLCVGAGALGSAIISYLAASGITNISIVDDDVVDISNLQRQPIHTLAFLNSLKVDSIKNSINKLNPHCHINSLPLKLSRANAYKLIQDHDLILDGTDNIESRYLIDEFCWLLGKPWIYGGVFQFEGQVSVFNYRGGPTYHDLYPRDSSQTTSLSCSEGGILGVVPGLIGLLQASEALKLTLGIGNTLSGQLLIVNIFTLQFKKIFIRKKFSIDNQRSILKIISPPAHDSHSEGEINYSIGVQTCKRLLKLNKIQLIDVRSEIEFAIEHIPGALNYPLTMLSEENTLKILFQLPTPLVVYCSLNSRAEVAYKLLAKAQIPCQKLENGLQAWKRNI
uniref:molybdopterin biosynthesis protein n=1 Tax=Chroothece richteriana TaxID=101928 RepID=UPI001FCCD785|nr:molybdopterin biosynthesis protein [Chroothece richteriana]UNJ14229.1 molybdopterin biosynthesis protein [Chroothece richteriana]